MNLLVNRPVLPMLAKRGGGHYKPIFTIRKTAALLTLLATVSCAPPPPKGPAQTLTTHPRALDRYARLRIRELVDLEPIAVHRQAECEIDRIFQAFGGVEGQLRLMSTDDSIYRSPVTRARFAKVEERFFGKGFEGSGPFCDSLKAIANREEPIAPVDSAIKNR